MEIDKYYADIRAGKMATISRAITLVENRHHGYLHLLDQLYQLPRHSLVIGITGAPGSGKSTFISQLVSRTLQHQEKIAIIAIDPSSKFSGGALLGDRIRFADNFSYERVFFRSMASHWSYGGVNPSLFNILQILNGAQFDWIIIESVGAGQNEMAIKKYVDIVLLLLVAGMGDEIQCMKAGIMEIADIFVVNKTDLYASASLYLALLQHLQGDASQRVLQTNALQDQDFEAVYQTIASFSSNCDYRRRSRADDTRLILQTELELFFHQEHMHKQLQQLLPTAASPYRIVEKAKELLENMLGN